MISSMIRQSYWFIIGLKHRLKRVFRLSAILVDLNGSIVNLSHCNYLNMIAETRVLTFSVNVTIDVLRYVLFKVIRVFSLLKQDIFKMLIILRENFREEILRCSPCIGISLLNAFPRLQIFDQLLL